MRDTYDCAVVLIPGHGPWLQQWLRRHQGQSLRAGHPRLFPQLPECAGQQASTVWLRASALSLRRFDACLLPVEAATLSWVRTALSVARQELSTPVLALVEGVGAIAVRDLLRLGLEDFLRPECPDELRLRVALAASRRQRQPASDWAPAAELSEPAAEPALDASLLDTPFGAAKARVVGHFERTYLHCSLARHEGNVTQAARAAAKHRRAFWALMRKHRIQAAPYREQARDRDPG